MAEIPDLTRRTFLAATGAAAAGAMVGCGGSDAFFPGPAVTKGLAWRLSTRNVPSASNAAKIHAANMRFASAAAANACRAHPGDKSNIVPIDVNPTLWETWFGGGATKVDLRHV